MKKDWKFRILEDACEKITDGSHFSPKTVGKGYPYITVKDLKNDIIDFINCKFINEKDYIELKKNNCQPEYGDVLFSKDGTVGKVSLINFKKEFVVLSSLAIIRPNKKILYSPFLKYIFKAPFFYNEAIGKKTGVAIRRIVLRNLKTIQIPLPPFSEQKRIVKILDEAFTSIDKAKENAEKNLANAKELFDSYLNGIFVNPGDDWKEKRLGELGIITSSKRIYKREYVNNGIPFYRTKEIKELANGNEISIELFISKSQYDEIKNKYGVPKEGDILLSAVGTIGEIYIVKKQDVFYFKDGNLIWLKNFDSINSYYLKYILKSYVKEIQKISVGSAYKALTIEKLYEYKIYLPNIKEQKSIVLKLDELSKETKRLEEIYRKKIEDLDELKRSILDKAFNGEL